MRRPGIYNAIHRVERTVQTLRKPRRATFRASRFAFRASRFALRFAFRAWAGLASMYIVP